MVVAISLTPRPDGLGHGPKLARAVRSKLGDPCRRLIRIGPLTAHFKYAQVTRGTQAQTSIEQRSDLKVGKSFQQRRRGFGESVRAELGVIDDKICRDLPSRVFHSVIWHTAASLGRPPLPRLRVDPRLVDYQISLHSTADRRTDHVCLDEAGHSARDLRLPWPFLPREEDPVNEGHRVEFEAHSSYCSVVKGPPLCKT